MGNLVILLDYYHITHILVFHIAQPHDGIDPEWNS